MKLITLSSWKRSCLALIVAATLFSFSANAQGTWNLAEPTDGSGSANAETAKGICTDASGNVYIVGVFNGASDFNLNSATVNSSTSAGNDGFVASYDKNGNYRWHTVISGSGSDFVSPSGGICTDGINVWFTGTVNMSGAPQVISGSNTITLASTGGTGTDIVVGKLACSNGAVNWAVEFGGSSGNDGGESVCVDPAGCCYVIGSYGPAFTLNGHTAPTSGGSSDLFIAKFNPGGGLIHVSTGGSTTGADMISNGGSICYVPGASPAIVASGSCANGGTITYGSFNTVSSGSIDGVLLELDTTLNFTNALVLGTATTATDEILGVTYDPFSGGVYIAGYYNGGIITLPGTSAMASSGAQDIMVARYSVASNNFVWAVHAGGTGDDRAESITADGQGGILISGLTASASCTFGGTVAVSNTGGVNDLYVARYNTSGAPVWALASGGSGDEQARGVASYIQPSPYVQNVYTTGNFQNTVTFGSTTLTADGTGNNDFFLARINDASAPLTATQSQVNLTCNGVCTGSATVVASGGTSPYTYSWSPSGGSGATASSLCATNYTVTITDAASSSITKTFSLTQPPAITTSVVSQNNVSCNGGNNGTAAISASGGTGTLAYNWTPGTPTGDGTTSVTGLAANTYTITVTDANSCTATRTFNITAPPALAVTPSQSNVSCFGGNNGSATVSVSGGTPSYSYSWAPSGGTGATASGRTAGTYTVTITDANSCTTTQTFNITQPTAPVSGSTVVTNVACFGGTNGAINLTPGGGTPGYTFQWLPSGPTTEDRTGLTAGTYTVQITDVNGCTGTVNATVTQPTSPVSGSTVVTNATCAGASNGTIDLTPGGGEPGYTYSWNGGITTQDRIGLAAGTYTVQITDANGCTGTASATVTEPPAVSTPTPSSNTPVCTGNTINLSTPAVPGATYSWTGPASFSSAVQNPSRTSATVAMAGTYSVTVTVGGCTSAAGTTAVVVNPTPATPTASSNTPVCTGNTINLSTPAVPGATYSWTGPNSFSSAVQNPSITNATVAMAGTYSVTVTTSGCTSAVGTTAVVVNPTPATPAASSNTPVCTGNTINLSTPAVPGATYSWTGPASFSSAVQNPSRTSATVAMAGTYSVTVTVGGCTSAAGTTAVVVNPTPATPTASSNTPVCTGNTINLSTPAVPGATYSWTGPNSFSSAVQNPSITNATVAMAGTYSVTVTTSGCTSAVGTTAVVVNPTPATPAASSNTPVCTGNTINLSTPAVPGATYSWTGPASFSSAVQNPSRTSATVAMAGTYSVTVTVGGCTSAAGTTAVVVNPTPATPTASSNTPVCTGNTINLSTPAVPGATYSWTGPNSFSSAVQNPSITNATVAMAGTYSVTVTTSGCTSAAGATAVVINPTPATPTASSNSPVCAGNTINLSTPAVSGATYSWTGPNTFSSAVRNPSLASSTTAMSGTYSVTIAISGCTSAAGTVAVTVNQSIALVALQTNVSCHGGPTGAASVTATGGTGTLTYDWTPGTPTGDGTNAVTGLMAGTYTVTVTDATTCSATATFNITEPPAIAATTVHTDATCNGMCDGTATVTPTGGTPGYTYNWVPTGGTSATATGLCSATYTCVVTDANGCSFSTIITIGQPTAIVVTATSTNVTCNGLCNGTATVSATGGTPGYTYSWSPSGGTSATATGLCPATYTCTVTDANGCTATQTATITEPPALAATATSANVTCNADCNGTATISVSGGTPGYAYSWAPSGGTSATATGLCPATYTCTVTDANGCTITQTVTITEPAALSVTLTQTNVTCNGACNGAANVAVSGGTPAYTYNWAPGGSTASFITGLCAGTYTCTITDANGCTTTQTVTITEPGVLVASSTATTILCNGGTADVTISATGGTIAYTGTGTETVNAGTYTYTVTDANGCSTTTSITVTEPAAITGTQTVTVCAGGSVTVGSNVYTATGTYTDILPAFNSCDSTVTTSLTVLPANTVSQSVTVCPGGSVTVGSNVYTATGTYTDVLPSSNTCDSTVTTNLTVLMPNNVSQTLTVCAGQSVTVGSMVHDTAGTFTDVLTSAAGCDSTVTTSLTVLPANATSQTLTICGGQSIMVGTATHDTSGVYTDVLVAANGCDSTVTTNLTVLPAIDVTVSVTANTATAATSGAGYQWLDCDNSNAIIAGETNQSFTATAAGNFAVEITVNGCADTSTCVNIVPEGIDDHTMANNVTVYPNPAAQMITVEIQNMKAGTENTVSLYDGLGKLVYNAVTTSEKTVIDLSKLSKGIYFIKLQNETGVITKKITKE